jgi:hypothetical protein
VLTTDQKVGGSSPSGRAREIAEGPGAAGVFLFLERHGTRRHADVRTDWVGHWGSQIAPKPRAVGPFISNDDDVFVGERLYQSGREQGGSIRGSDA